MKADEARKRPMKHRATGLLLAAHALAFAQPQPAVPEDDSQRIPSAVLQEEAEKAPPVGASSVFIEGNGELVSRRTLIVPIAATDSRREVLRALADGRGDWQIGPGLT